MRGYEFGTAEHLLNIVDKARHWPRLKPIHDAAMAELEKLAERAVEKPKPLTPDEDLRSAGEDHTGDVEITGEKPIIEPGTGEIERKV